MVTNGMVIPVVSFTWAFIWRAQHALAQDTDQLTLMFKSYFYPDPVSEKVLRQIFQLVLCFDL